MRLAANLSLLYGGLTPAEQIAAAARDGFRYVEILAPYDHEPDWYARQLQAHGLQLVLINTPVVSSDWPVGLAAQTGVEGLFQEALTKAAEVCRATSCKAIHVLAGKTVAQQERRLQQQALHAHLTWAAQAFPDLTLHLEALNRFDVPDYFYAWPEQVARELSLLDQANVGMQFDFYHVVKEGLALVEQLEQNFPRIRHVQVAGAPDRHEPDLRHDDFLAGFRRLHELGYDGYIGLEYRPRRDVVQGLSWLQPLLDKGLLRY